MYFCVYLFTNKPTGPHEVDFVIGTEERLIPKGAGGGGGLITKPDFKTVTADAQKTRALTRITQNVFFFYNSFCRIISVPGNMELKMICACTFVLLCLSLSQPSCWARFVHLKRQAKKRDTAKKEVICKIQLR